MKGTNKLNKTVKVIIDGEQYTAVLNDNLTVDDILKMLPIQFTATRLLEHEYYGQLPEKPSMKGVKTTTNGHAQGIYYFDGWTVLTIKFGDAPNGPVKVHVGDIVEEITSQLKYAGDTVNIKIVNLDD